MPAGRLAERRRLALRAGQARELVHVVHGVLVVGHHGEVVLDVLEPMLDDQVRAGVVRLPARPVERHGPLQPRRGLVEERRPVGSAKGKALEVGEHLLR
jgi:hypothetical protein